MSLDDLIKSGELQIYNNLKVIEQVVNSITTYRVYFLNQKLDSYFNNDKQIIFTYFKTNLRNKLNRNILVDYYIQKAIHF